MSAPAPDGPAAPAPGQPGGGGISGRFMAVIVAAVVLVVVAVFLTWRSDRLPQGDQRVPNGVLGVQHAVDGLALLDVALVATGERRLGLLATLTVRSGPPDRVTGVTVDGVAASLPGAPADWRVAHQQLLDLRPRGDGLRVEVPAARDAAPGTFVPVTVVFAGRGPTTFEVPVWPADVWSSDD